MELQNIEIFLTSICPVHAKIVGYYCFIILLGAHAIIQLKGIKIIHVVIDIIDPIPMSSCA